MRNRLKVNEELRLLFMLFHNLKKTLILKE